MAIALINETPYPAFGFDTELYDEKEYHSLAAKATFAITAQGCLLYTSPSPRD